MKLFLLLSFNSNKLMSFAAEVYMELNASLLSSIRFQYSRSMPPPQNRFDEHGGMLSCGGVPDNGLFLWVNLRESDTLAAPEDKDATKEKTFGGVL